MHVLARPYTHAHAYARLTPPQALDVAASLIKVADARSAMGLQPAMQQALQEAGSLLQQVQGAPEGAPEGEHLLPGGPQGEAGARACAHDGAATAVCPPAKRLSPGNSARCVQLSRALQLLQLGSAG